MNPLPSIPSPRGAPMGRADSIPADYATVRHITLERVLPCDGGDYDSGGAYWGNLGGSPLYVAHGESETEQACAYFRARDEQDATEQARATFPAARIHFDGGAAFLRGYLIAALWTTDDDAGSGDYEASGRGDDLMTRIHPSSLQPATADCQAFRLANAAELAACGLDSEHAGHDFWLTRNHHGTGFWDRDFEGPEQEAALKALSDAAHAAGERYCSIDADAVYIE